MEIIYIGIVKKSIFFCFFLQNRQAFRIFTYICVGQTGFWLPIALSIKLKPGVEWAVSEDVPEWSGCSMVQTGMTVPEFVNCCHAVRYLVDAREFDLPRIWYFGWFGWRWIPMADRKFAGSSFLSPVYLNV